MRPVEALGQIAEASGVPYLVDACQAIGQIPLDVSKLKCDCLSATARKFLRGPRGIGFLYVSDRALKRGDFPLYIDMRGADWSRRTTSSRHPMRGVSKIRNSRTASCSV